MRGIKEANKTINRQKSISKSYTPMLKRSWNELTSDNYKIQNYLDVIGLSMPLTFHRS